MCHHKVILPAMTWLIVLSLIVVGIIFLLLEILVVPGATIVGLAGLGMLIGGVVVAFNHYGVQTGVITLISALTLSVIAITLALKSNTWKKAMLGSTLEGRVNMVEPDQVVKGDEGMAITRLNPMGKAMIKGDYYEVTSKDNLINENTLIEVVKVEGNKIIVKPKT
jgi:membrane-bound ClpP family serine protease